MPKINTKGFLSTLQKISSGLADKEIVEQSTSFLFEKGIVYTFNDELYAYTNTPPNLRKLNCAVSGLELISILKKIPDEEIHLTIREHEIHLKGKRISCGIKTEKIKLNVPHEIGVPNKWHKINPEFTEGLKACLPATRNDPSNPILSCIHVTSQFIEACDNYRLTRYTLETGMDKNLLLPASTTKQLIQHDITHCALEETLEGWTCFKTKEGIILGTRIYSGTYPTFQHILDDTKDTKPIKIMGKISEVIDRCLVFIDDFKIDARIHLFLKENELILRGEGPVGWVEETIKIKYKGEENAALVNPFSLRPIVEKLRTCRKGKNTIQFRTKNILHALWTYHIEEGDY